MADPGRRLSRPRRENPEDERGDQKRRQSKHAACSTNLLLPKLKQKPNQDLRYENTSAFRKTLTTDMICNRHRPITTNEGVALVDEWMPRAQYNLF